MVRHTDDEQRWRQALMETGQQEVMRQLRYYPGRPQDVLSNLPLEPPYPTREFCQEWCLEEDGRGAKSMVRAGVIFALLGVVMLSFGSCVLSGYLGDTGAPANAPNPTPTPSGQQRPGTVGRQ